MVSDESNTGFIPTDDKPVLFTEAAVKAVREALSQEAKPGDGLRISVAGGGCAGYQYSLDFESEVRMDDLTINFDGIKVFIDSVSTGYLKGTVVDYVSGLQGNGFKFNNPNAKKTCGCGHSFEH